MFNVQGAGPVQGQSLAVPGSTVCLATQQESGEQGSVNMYGKPGDFSFSGSQKRPTIIFQQKDMGEQGQRESSMMIEGHRAAYWTQYLLS